MFVNLGLGWLQRCLLGNLGQDHVQEQVNSCWCVSHVNKLWTSPSPVFRSAPDRSHNSLQNIKSYKFFELSYKLLKVLLLLTKS